MRSSMHTRAWGGVQRAIAGAQDLPGFDPTRLEEARVKLQELQDQLDQADILPQQPHSVNIR